MGTSRPLKSTLDARSLAPKLAGRYHANRALFAKRRGMCKHVLANVDDLPDVRPLGPGLRRPRRSTEPPRECNRLFAEEAQFTGRGNARCALARWPVSTQPFGSNIVEEICTSDGKSAGASLGRPTGLQNV